MTERRKGAVDRKLKFSPDPASPLDVVNERLGQVENELRLIRQSMQMTTLNAFDRAPYIDPSQGELLWDFQYQRSYIHHHDKWRPTQPPTYHIKVFADIEDVEVGDEAFVFMVSRDMGGFTSDVEDADPYPSFYLYDAEAYVTTAGANTIQVRNKTEGQDMLSTPLTIDSYTTVTAGTERVIHPTNSIVSWGDLISIDVDAAGGRGLGVLLVFNPFIDTP